MLTGPKGAFGWIFLAVGLFLAIGAVWNIVDANRIALSGDTAIGLVIGYEIRSGSRITSYIPVIAFTDHAGTPRQFVHKLGGRKELYREGEKVRVRYDRQMPERAVIDGFYGRWSFLIVLLFALPFIAIGIWAIRSDRAETAFLRE